ncbi:hypothetical protein A0H81_11312 [Grifola frondosa]|uniref:Uncharacterized protein n=1 Tax=Grifola frondosa TaxID=5627 RepID=A0A1C7LY78_GRIFR|nr:hypothetical protein A0H81_11312 [Grifola frondosa]
MNYTPQFSGTKVSWTLVDIYLGASPVSAKDVRSTKLRSEHANLIQTYSEHSDLYIVINCVPRCRRRILWRPNSTRTIR